MAGCLRQQRQQNLGDIGHVVPSHQQVGDVFRSLRRPGSAIRHLVKRVLTACGCAETVAAKSVDARSRYGLHQRACCTEPGTAIVGDDGVGFADDRSVGDVAVIGTR